MYIKYINLVFEEIIYLKSHEDWEMVLLERVR